MNKNKHLIYLPLAILFLLLPIIYLFFSNMGYDNKVMRRAQTTFLSEQAEQNITAQNIFLISKLYTPIVYEENATVPDDTKKVLTYFQKLSKAGLLPQESAKYFASTANSFKYSELMEYEGYLLIKTIHYDENTYFRVGVHPLSQKLLFFELFIPSISEELTATQILEKYKEYLEISEFTDFKTLPYDAKDYEDIIVEYSEGSGAMVTSAIIRFPRGAASVYAKCVYTDNKTFEKLEKETLKRMRK